MRTIGGKAVSYTHLLDLHEDSVPKSEDDYEHDEIEDESMDEDTVEELAEELEEELSEDISEDDFLIKDFDPLHEKEIG